MKSVVETADSGLETADYSADSNTNQAKVGVWVQAFYHLVPSGNHQIMSSHSYNVYTEWRHLLMYLNI